MKTRIAKLLAAPVSFYYELTWLCRGVKDAIGVGSFLVGVSMGIIFGLLILRYLL